MFRLASVTSKSIFEFSQQKEISTFSYFFLQWMALLARSEMSPYPLQKIQNIDVVAVHAHEVVHTQNL